MAENGINDIYKARLSPAEFSKLSSFIYREYGIKMPPIKKTMLESRLQKRLRALNLSSFREYVDYVFSKQGQEKEVIQMIDMVSTNKTDFFREPGHFEFLESTCLPDFLKTNSPGIRPFMIWSAGCSSGEEPYTMAICMNEFAEKNKGFDYSIFATDISTRMLQSGVDAVYNESRIDGLPLYLKYKYFMRNKNPEIRTVRVVPELRRKVNFHRLNFMDPVYRLDYSFDAIFCRNVLIYFDRDTQESVLNKLASKLKKDGIFILGHSESISNLNVPLAQIKPTIFKKI